MPVLTITWHSMHDNNVCPICRALDGYTWIFETGKDALSGELVHPQFGVVWTTATGSAAHEYGHRLGGFPSGCRCHITYDLQLGDLVQRLQKIVSFLEALPTE